MPTPDDVRIEDVRAARDRLAGIAVRTPLVRLEVPGAAGEIWLKLENLQPIGSFKLRGAANAMLSAGRDRLARGAYTASAGNMAQGVAWSARHLGVPCTVVVPEHAPATKVDAVERLGGRVVKVPFDRWWQTMVDHSYPGIDGLFVHPVSDPAVIAGNGTIGLEIVEDLPDVDTVLVPFGGGGLSSGIATAVRALRPDVKVFGCEAATSTPLTAALAAGEPVRVVRSPSFIDGIGGNAKAAIYRGYKLLTSGHANEGVDTLRNVTSSLDSTTDPAMRRVAAVAHYLIGKAHEAAGDRSAAMNEFNACLRLAPDYLMQRTADGREIEH